jgi:hypothetical protein
MMSSSASSTNLCPSARSTAGVGIWEVAHPLDYPPVIARDELGPRYQEKPPLAGAEALWTHLAED